MILGVAIPFQEIVLTIFLFCYPSDPTSKTDIDIDRGYQIVNVLVYIKVHLEAFHTKAIYAFAYKKQGEKQNNPRTADQAPNAQEILSIFSLLRFLFSLALHFITLLKQEFTEHTERIGRPSTKGKNRDQ